MGKIYIVPLLAFSLMISSCDNNDASFSYTSSEPQITSQSTSEHTSSTQGQSTSESSSSQKEEVNEQIYQIYQLYLSNGGSQTYDEWLESIKGEKGDKGDTGAQGPQGEKGEQGESAFDIFKVYHPEYIGTKEEWINDVASGNKCNLFGHEKSDDWQIDTPAACNHVGYKSKHCVNCGEKLEEETIPMIEHSWNEGKYEGDEKGGVMTFECDVCGAEKHESTSSVWTGFSFAPSVVTNIDGINYYEINTAEELAYLSSCDETWLGFNYILKKDIVLNSEATNNVWIPIGGGDYQHNVFTGVLNGNGKTIFNMKLVTKGEDWGFVRSLNQNGVIKDINFEGVDVNVSTSHDVGVVAGNVNGETSSYGCCLISNCSVSGSIHGKAEANVGGICGDIRNVDIINCTNNANIELETSTMHTGGIYGASLNTEKASVKNCINNGTITAGLNVGGIGGLNNYPVTDCINNGDIFGAGDNVGGIVGSAREFFGESEYINCTNNGNITGKNSVGGICGKNDIGIVKNCNNYGLINGNTNVGGIAGSNVYAAKKAMLIENSINRGKINGRSEVGGIIGLSTANNYKIANCTNYGNVVGSVPFTNVGGIIGNGDVFFSNCTIENCKYLKNDSVNKTILGIGNLNEEYEHITTISE